MYFCILHILTENVYRRWMMMESVWWASAALPRFPKAEQDMKTDVLIIGGGIAGILTAYRLRQAGVDCVLTEASRICSGITKNTTAKITSQHGACFDGYLRRFGRERTRLYYEANEWAIGEYRQMCRDISCSFEEKSAFLYARDNCRRLEKELRALEEIGVRAAWEKTLPLPFPVAGAIRFDGQAQFHPLRFLGEVAKGLPIYEDSTVRELVGTVAVLDRCRIKAKQIVVATHFPFLNKHGAYFLKLYQSRSYVSALSGAADVNGMYVDEQEGGISLRNAGELLLVGAGSHRTGKPDGGWQALSDFAAKYYPRSQEEYRWATQDCMTLDNMPYIGRYSSGTKGLWVATGFHKWGMTTAMVAAQLLTDLICGKKNPYEALFSPSRRMLRPQLAANAASSVAGLVNFSTKRCPHLGCALKWNSAERSWDCPCHGSRFTEDGKLIDNPATGDLKK